MSGICGCVGEADPSILDAHARRRSTIAAIAPTPPSRQASALGYRWWADRPGKSPAIHRAGPTPGRLRGHARAAGRVAGGRAAGAPARAAPPRPTDRRRRLRAAPGGTARARRLTLLRDPFGVRSLYYVEHGRRALLRQRAEAAPGRPGPAGRARSHGAAQVPHLLLRARRGRADARRAAPAARPRRAPGRPAQLDAAPYFTLREAIDPALGRSARRGDG